MSDGTRAVSASGDSPLRVWQSAAFARRPHEAKVCSLADTGFGKMAWLTGSTTESRRDSSFHRRRLGHALAPCSQPEANHGEREIWLWDLPVNRIADWLIRRTSMRGPLLVFVFDSAGHRNSLAGLAEWDRKHDRGGQKAIRQASS